jgi:hypothetical protein
MAAPTTDEEETRTERTIKAIAFVPLPVAVAFLARAPHLSSTGVVWGGLLLVGAAVGAIAGVFCLLAPENQSRPWSERLAARVSAGGVVVSIIAFTWLGIGWLMV